MFKAVQPKCKEVPSFGGTKSKEYTHDAFGVIGMSVVTGEQTLFGSDLNHGQTIRIRISRAKLTRNLSTDSVSPDSSPFIEVSLSHNQFAEFITNPNRGVGIPCTINYAPEPDAKIKAMPGIKKIESKMDMMKEEVRNSAKEQMAKIEKSFNELSALVENGGGKKAMKEALFSMKCQIENTPSNMSFVVEQAEETLANAVTSAKIEVEAYIGNAINNLGIEAAKSIGLTNSTTQGFLENENK